LLHDDDNDFICTFQSMQILKKSDLKPYFIFIAPGSIPKLKQMRQQQGVSVTVRIVLLWPPYVIGGCHYIFALWFVSSYGRPM